MHSSLILQGLALFSISAIAAPTPGGRSAAPTLPAIPEVPSSGPDAATLKHAVFNPVSPHFGSWNFFTLDDPRVDYWKRNPDMEVRYFKYCPKCGEYPFHNKYVLAEHLIKEDLATTGQGALDKANELPVIVGIRNRPEPEAPSRPFFLRPFSSDKKGQRGSSGKTAGGQTTAAPPWNFDS